MKETSTVGTIDQMIRDMKNGVYDYTDNGKCISCGSCCSNYLPLSSKDLKEIRRYIEKHHIKPSVHAIPAVVALDHTCPFRDNDRKICTIYKVRPKICKLFKCDLPSKEVGRDVMIGRYEVYDMRETFYGENK